MTDGFEVDPGSVDRFRTGALADLRSGVDRLRGRLSGTAVPAHAYTTIEPGNVAFVAHRSVLEGFDERLRLAARQVETLDERLHATAAEYRANDAAGSEGITRAGDGIEGVV